MIMILTYSVFSVTETVIEKLLYDIKPFSDASTL